MNLEYLNPERRPTKMGKNGKYEGSEQRLEK